MKAEDIKGLEDEIQALLKENKELGALLDEERVSLGRDHRIVLPHMYDRIWNDACTTVLYAMALS